MSEIIISGYYGFNNVGDELILKAIIDDLRNCNQNIQLTVLSATAKKTADDYKVRSINRWNFVAIVREISGCKMLLSGGGGLFQDTTSIVSPWYYLFIILLAKCLKKKVFIYAVGIGEIRYPLNKFLIKKCFNNVDFITVRSEQDKKLLLEFGINKEIIVTADPVFGLNIRGRIRVPQKQIVGLIVRKTKNWENDVPVFSDMVELIVKKLSAEVVLIPFQQSQDLELLNAIKKNTILPIKIIIWYNIAELLELFFNFDIIISMRLHGLILAAKYGIPFVAISRYSKISNFLQLVGENIKNDELNAEQLFLQVSDKINKTRLGKMEVIMSEIASRAKKTAELCMSVLKWQVER